jgi:hypothetical protein
MHRIHTFTAAVVLAVTILTGAPGLASAQTTTQSPPVPCESQVVYVGTYAAPAPRAGALLCDSDGLIVHQATPDHPYGDGGDTAQREGWYWLGVWIRQNTPGLTRWAPRRRLNFDQVLALLEPHQDGVFYRHPKLAPWNNPRDKEFGFSRDQMVPLIAAMGVWGKTAHLERLWNALPEDSLGKHSFNGSWRNILGQDGWDCTAIKNRDCSGRDCTLRTDNRDCSLKVDTRDCTFHEDTRGCGDFDFFCKLARQLENDRRRAESLACEVAKATQNALYAGERVACEAAKATQNAIYVAEKQACEVVKAGENAACEAQKATELNLCRLGNFHNGDFIGPMTENLFARARNQSLSSGTGEVELLANAWLRVRDGRDRDNTGDDLNLLVMLLMAKLRNPSPPSDQAADVLAGYRPFSYGSYLTAYRAAYSDATDMRTRMDAGIQSGWQADKTAVNGAVHWYHRIESGGNPELAELYDPIIHRFIYGDTTGVLARPTSLNPAPTIATVSPGAGLSSGGTLITITGSNFRAGTTVLVDGVAALDVRVVDATTLTAATPEHGDGTVSVTVTVPFPGGGSATLADAFTYRSTAPEPLPFAPVGNVDTPQDNQTGVTGAIAFTGWALDDSGTTTVAICRDAVAGEVFPANPNCGGAAQVFLGNGVFIEGARPDVQAAFPWYPRNDRAGWGFMVLTNMLPNQGNGTYTFAVYAVDPNGAAALLGTRTLHCDNAHATRPFGTLDTPAQGETISGRAYVNFGWALTQRGKSIVSNASLTVYIDGVAVGHPSYGHDRADIAQLFPGLANSTGAIGYYVLDTTTLRDGLHTIAWTATDSAGQTTGLGSRFFRVANAGTNGAAVTAAASVTTVESELTFAPADRSPILARRGWGEDTPWSSFAVGRSERAVIRGEEMDRFELRLGEETGATYTGFVRAGDSLNELPAGSRLNAETGEFTWSPAAGFVGTYDLLFVRRVNGQVIARIEVRFVLHPKGSGHTGARAVIDTPQVEQEVASAFMLAGWAADLNADAGTGVSGLHVWAYPTNGAAPIFLGTPDYGAARPDVAAVHGEAFRPSGYGLIVRGLPPGQYDVAVFPWSTVTNGFASAGVVRVVVK